MDSASERINPAKSLSFQAVSGCFHESMLPDHKNRRIKRLNEEIYVLIKRRASSNVARVAFEASIFTYLRWNVIFQCWKLN